MPKRKTESETIMSEQAIPAGRELDRAFAEKVLGAHVVHHEDTDLYDLVVPGPFTFTYADWSREEWAWDCVPRYSERMDLAWQAVTLFGAKRGNYQEVGFQSALKELCNSTRLDTMLYALTPEIICRAALFAVGYGR